MQDSNPSKNSPPIAALRRRSRCLPAVPPRPPSSLASAPLPGVVCRDGRVEGAGSKALLHRRVWYRSATVAGVGRPAPSWASFLFKVLPDSWRSRLLPPRAAARAPEGDERWQAPHRARRASPAEAGPTRRAARHPIRGPLPRSVREEPTPAEADASPASRNRGDPHRGVERGTRSRPKIPPRVHRACEVHCTADRLANQSSGRPTLQASLQGRRPMPSKSVRS